jgi:hypothetical protein
MVLVIRGYEYPMDINRKCTGCNRTFGPSTDFKVGYLVKDGEVTGLFHSRACFEATKQKFEAYQKNKGGEEEDL